MKAAAFVFLLAICCIQCRKIVPINKNANIDFINMEIGGGARPNTPQSQPAPVKPNTVPPPVGSPAAAPHPLPVTTLKPVPVGAPSLPAPITDKPASTPVKPAQPSKPLPNQMDLKPVPLKPSTTGGVTTPGYGNVKQLVTFYDSHGKASIIRPHTYSQAVKQG